MLLRWFLKGGYMLISTNKINVQRREFLYAQVRLGVYGATVRVVRLKVWRKTLIGVHSLSQLPTRTLLIGVHQHVS